MTSPKVLSISTVFPHPGDESVGLFVRNRLLHVARILPLKVVAPVPLIRYGGASAAPAVTPRRRDGELDIFHPRWFYPPKAGVANGAFLAARLLPLLRRLRAEYRFDVLDAHFGQPEGVAAALLSRWLGIPFVITLRGNEVAHAEAAWRRRGMSWAFRRAARLITVSEPLRRFAIGLGADPGRVRTIPNGLDVSMFYPRGYAESRALLGIPAGRPMILSAGHLVENKGHHRVARALAELRRQGSPAELWIVGGPGRAADFREQILAAAREGGIEDAVHFIGPVKQALLAQYMSAADVFCLASLREGWPNVVHEALGCGAPAVASDVGGVPEMIGSPDHGIVIPPGDQAALTAALAEALRRTWDRERISAWGRARSWPQVAAEAAAVLREAAG